MEGFLKAKGFNRIELHERIASSDIEKAIVHAAKAAYLAKLIEHKASSFVRFNDPMEVKDWLVEQPFFTRLNKLKKSNSEAFFIGLGFLSWKW